MKVSIVVPVFNVEKYLSKCIESILVQSFTDFELLLIDDGSTDKSLDICRMYEVRDRRIHVYRQSNSGPSKARNLGIAKAQGDFVIFIDSDDYVDSDYLLELTKYDSDLVSSGFKLWYSKDNRTEYKSYDHFFKATKEEHNINLAIEEGEFKYLLAGPCCKLYRRSLLEKHHIFFDEGLTYGEDHLFNLCYLQYIEDIVLTPYAGYVYTHYDKPSLTNRIIPYKEMNRYNGLCLETRKSLTLQFNLSKKYIAFSNFKYCFYFWQMIASIYLSYEKNKVRKSIVRELLKEKLISDKQHVMDLPITYKTASFLFRLLPFEFADFILIKIIFR